VDFRRPRNLAYSCVRPRKASTVSNMLFVWNSGATFLSDSWWRQSGTMDPPSESSTWTMDGCPVKICFYMEQWCDISE
jgi:hypothetical protein